jgi:hypothetical protein
MVKLWSAEFSKKVTGVAVHGRCACVCGGYADGVPTAWR